MPEFDQRSFRSALGRFTTGVTIITARGADGRAVGVTANSFNSVSLDPPLVLWSLGRASSSLAAYESAEEFVIHVLGLEQQELSNRFASKGIDKFAGMEVGQAGAPLLDGCSARFHCRKVQRHDVGDHVLFIGEVVDFFTSDVAPLLYLHGRYGEARRFPIAASSYDLEAARIGKSAILNLFTHAYVRILNLVNTEFAALALQQPLPVVLIALADGLTSLAEINKFLVDRAHEFSVEMQEDMIRRELISIHGDDVEWLPQGRKIYGKMLAALERVENRLITDFTAGELAEAKHSLATLGHFDL